MIDQEARSERIAIRIFDGHLSEYEAILLTDSELKSKEPNENIQRILRLQERKKMDEAERKSKRSTRFSYD